MSRRLMTVAVIAALGIAAAATSQFSGLGFIRAAEAQTPKVCNCAAPSAACARYCSAWWAKDPRYCKGPAANCYQRAVGAPHARTGRPSTPEDAREWCSRPRTC